MAFPWAAAAMFAGTGASLYAGRKQQKAQANAFRHRILEAQKFGIHPLAAVGSAGTPMGDGGYGTMASGFAQSARAYAQHQEQKQREDDLMDREMYKQMWMASEDPRVRRELEERMLGPGNVITPSKPQNTPPPVTAPRS